MTFLTVATPAADRSLIGIEQLRQAAGLDADDDSQDDGLTALGDRISAEIVSACEVAIGSGAPPTLRQESLREIIVLQAAVETLVLARRHAVEVTSITRNGDAIEVASFDVDTEAGTLRHCDHRWPCGRYEITYQAGLDEVPDDLAGVAADLVRIRLSEQSRDPLARSSDVTVTGIEEVSSQFWVGAVPSTGTSSMLPADLLARLKRYMNASFG